MGTVNYFNKYRKYKNKYLNIKFNNIIDGGNGKKYNINFKKLLYF